MKTLQPANGIAHGILASSAIERIAVLRALKLGDLLCAIPAIRALKQQLPDAKVTLIGLPWAAEFVSRYPHYFSDFLEFPGWPGLPERPYDAAAVADFLSAAQARRFDFAIQMHGSGSHVNDITALLGARASGGFFERGQWCPDATTYIEYPAHLPEIWKHLRLMQALGAPSCGEALEFPLSAADGQQLAFVFRSAEPAPYIVIHIGTDANRDARWDPENFAAVADTLASRFRIVFSGTEADRCLVNEVTDRMRAAHINLCGKTTLGALGALIGKARLLICHDTGVSHIAAALKTPSIIIFNRSDREGWPPRDRRLHRFISRFSGITVEEVLQEAMELLQTRPFASLGQFSPQQAILEAEL